jgi:hypothetical protein
MENIQQYIQIGIQVVGVAAALAAVLPIPQAIGPLIIARKFLDILAMNFGNAKNVK